jgi:hypothetical protein
MVIGNSVENFQGDTDTLARLHKRIKHRMPDTTLTPALETEEHTITSPVTTIVVFSYGCYLSLTAVFRRNILTINSGFIDKLVHKYLLLKWLKERKELASSLAARFPEI